MRGPSERVRSGFDDLLLGANSNGAYNLPLTPRRQQPLLVSGQVVKR